MGGREIGGSGGAGRPLAGIGCGASDNAGPARYGRGCTTSNGCCAQLRTQSLIWQWASWAGALACGACSACMPAWWWQSASPSSAAAATAWAIRPISS
ncbi:hypothetical protein G6F21_014507 [Rhizopus arrhizus]|nr:hypothetical protein G6F21_014507 [Rhizopus arrhizus]